jgi:2-hydroxy-3-keto-5-methylthiopentenyl-1-phosphate phosphatase
MKLIQEINLQIEDCLLSFHVASLLNNVPGEEVLQVIRNKLNMDPSLHPFTEWSYEITGHLFKNHALPV